MFKKDQKVKVVNQGSHYLKVGTVATVTEVLTDNSCLVEGEIGEQGIEKGGFQPGHIVTQCVNTNEVTPLDTDAEPATI